MMSDLRRGIIWGTFAGLIAGSILGVFALVSVGEWVGHDGRAYVIEERGCVRASGCSPLSIKVGSAICVAGRC